MSVRLMFAWYDFWVGWFWDRKKRALYVGFLPTLILRLGFCAHCDAGTWQHSHPPAYKGRAGRYLPKRPPATGVGTYGYPLRNVVRVDVSPMNARVRIYSLECGHSSGRPAQRGPGPKVMACDSCPKPEPPR